MKPRMRVIAPLVVAAIGCWMAGAAGAATSEHARLQLKPLGVPAYKDTVLTREQAKAQQEAYKKRDEQMVKEVEARRDALDAIAGDYVKHGVSIHQFHDIYRLIAPALEQVSDPRRRKQRGESLARAFRSRVEPILKKKVAVEVYTDAKEQHRLK